MCSRSATSSSEVAWKPFSLNICAATRSTASRLLARSRSRSPPGAQGDSTAGAFARGLRTAADLAGARRGLAPASAVERVDFGGIGGVDAGAAHLHGGGHL